MNVQYSVSNWTCSVSGRSCIIYSLHSLYKVLGLLHSVIKGHMVGLQQLHKQVPHVAQFPGILRRDSTSWFFSSASLCLPGPAIQGWTRAEFSTNLRFLAVVHCRSPPADWTILWPPGKNRSSAQYRTSHTSPEYQSWLMSYHRPAHGEARKSWST
jgi:hypothetical protein